MLIGALEAGGTKMVCSIGNPEGGVLQRASFQTLTPDVTVPQIVDFIGKFDVKALGIGSFGPLDLNPASPTYGNITKTPKKEWIDYPLMTTLKNALGVPTGIDTDVNAAALAEYTMGAGKGRGSLLYVTVGTGIGGGFVTDGRMIHGLVHPEMGHMILAPLEGDTMPDGVCPYPQTLSGRTGKRPGNRETLGTVGKADDGGSPRVGAGGDLSGADVRKHDRHSLAGGDRTGRRRDAAGAPVPEDSREACSICWAVTFLRRVSRRRVSTATLCRPRWASIPA